MKVQQVTVRYWLGSTWGEEEVYQIVESSSNPSEGVINIDTPLAKAIIGKKAGEIVVVNKETKYLIENIVAEPELLDLIESSRLLFRKYDDIGLIDCGSKLSNLLLKATVLPKDISNICGLVISAHLNHNDVLSALNWINSLPARVQGLDFIKEKLNEIIQQQRGITIDNITDSYLLDRLAGLHKELRAYKKAKLIYLKSLDIDKENIYTLNGLGGVCRAAGWHDEGIVHYNAAYDINPNDVSLVGLGAIYRDLGEFDLAKGYYLDALRINYKNDYAHNGLGAVYFDLGNYEEGKVHFELAGDNSSYLFNLFYEYKRADLTEKAIECLNVILMKDPMNSRAHNLFNRISNAM